MSNQINEKAVIHRYGSPFSIRVEKSAVCEPASGEVLIKIEASSISATDVLIRKGIYPLLKEKPPFTLGYDLVGTIVKVGENPVYTVGDRVAALVQTGGNARFICLDENRLLKVSKTAEATELVCLPLNYMTAYQMLQEAGCLQKGKVILVQGGSGAVGTALCQLGRYFELKIVATASAEKLDHVKKQGAVAVDYRSDKMTEELKEQAPEGYDAIFDAVGNKNFSRSFKLLKNGGRLITYGTIQKASGIKKKTFLNFIAFGLSFAQMLLGNWARNRLHKNKKAIFFGIVTSLEQDREKFQQDLNFLCDLLENGAIKPEIHQVFSLNEVREGHELYDSGKVKGQLVIKMNQ